jgi:CheY-like chemotaxis protein
VICVRDTGIGFPPDEAARIFESFVQLDGSRKEAAGGLGLGLTLVRSLVEMHGGRVEARSSGDGQGAEFTVRLPVAAAPGSTATAAQIKTTARSGRRVLVVDDNTDAADTLADLLRIEGFNVRSANSGEVALSVATEFTPDVAFIDLNMPGMSGLELARALRGDTRMAGVRLVALTGMGQQADLVATRAAGFDAHLTKPAPLEDVLRLASGASETNVLPFSKGETA